MKSTGGEISLEGRRDAPKISDKVRGGGELREKTFVEWR